MLLTNFVLASVLLALGASAAPAPAETQVAHVEVQDGEPKQGEAKFNIHARDDSDDDLDDFYSPYGFNRHNNFNRPYGFNSYGHGFNRYSRVYRRDGQTDQTDQTDEDDQDADAFYGYGFNRHNNFYRPHGFNNYGHEFNRHDRFYRRDAEAAQADQTSEDDQSADAFYGYGFNRHNNFYRPHSFNNYGHGFNRYDRFYRRDVEATQTDQTADADQSDDAFYGSYGHNNFRHNRYGYGSFRPHRSYGYGVYRRDVDDSDAFFAARYGGYGGFRNNYGGFRNNYGGFRNNYGGFRNYGGYGRVYARDLDFDKDALDFHHAESSDTDLKIETEEPRFRFGEGFGRSAYARDESSAKLD